MNLGFCGFLILLVPDPIFQLLEPNPRVPIFGNHILYRKSRIFIILHRKSASKDLDSKGSRCSLVVPIEKENSGNQFLLQILPGYSKFFKKLLFSEIDQVLSFLYFSLCFCPRFECNIYWFVIINIYQFSWITLLFI